MSALAETFDLLQHLGAPAAAATAALDDVQAMLKRVQGAAATAMGGLDKVETKLRELRKAASGVDLSKMLAFDTAKPRDEMGRFVGSSKSGLADLLGGASATTLALGALGGVAAVAAGAGFHLASAGASYAAEMAKFKQDAEFSFKFITGSQQKAGEVMTMADELARAMGAKTSTVTESIRELMASGFDAGESKAITAAIGDIKAFNPTADTKGLNAALAKMQGSQKFSLEVAESILRAGVDDSKFYAILQQVTGSKDRAALFKKISAGKVNDKQGLEAVLKAIQEQGGGGPLGSAAAEHAATTTSGAFENALAMVERLFLAIDTSPIGAKFTEWATMGAKLFDPAGASGQRLLAVFNRVVGLFGLIFKNVDSNTLLVAFDAIVVAAKMIVGVLEPLAGGFGEVFGEAITTVMELVGFLAGGADTGAGFADAMKLIGQALGYLVLAVGVVVVALGWLASWVARVGAFLAGSWGSIGVAMIDGLVNGWDSAKGRLLERVTALGQLLPAKFRELLGIHSPSRVFAQLGVYTLAGYDQGLRKGPQPADSLAQLMEIPPPPRLARAQAPVGLLPQMTAQAGAGRGRGGQPVQISLTVQVDASGRDDADEVARKTADRTESTLVSLFERLVLESGAGLLPGGSI